MGGIINYYHGETGRVADRRWAAGKDVLTYRLRLNDNPHREWSQDYGTDIGIDPSLRDDDQVTYVRLDETCGIWVRPQHTLHPELSDAVARVIRNRQWMAQYGNFLAQHSEPPPEWLHHLRKDTNAKVDIVEELPTTIDDRPATAASLFLSYSSKDILLARQIYQDLKRDARADVWFDIAQSCDSPDHDDRIAGWLRNAIYQRRGFVLLLTDSARRSPWVQREIEWAIERQDGTSAFLFVILKLNDCPVPDVVERRARVIDCHGLWKINGINEELFAAVTGRPGRRARRGEQPAMRAASIDKGVFGYADFQCDGGMAIDFRWRLLGRGLLARLLGWRRQIVWHLDYDRDGETLTVSGRGDYEPVDLGIRPGDRIGSFVCRHRWGTNLPEGVSVWMRTDDLSLTPDSVLDAYYERSDVARRFNPDVIRRRLFLERGHDAWGRLIAELIFETKRGERISYPQLMLLTFTRRSMAQRGEEAADECPE